MLEVARYRHEENHLSYQNATRRTDEVTKLRRCAIGQRKTLLSILEGRAFESLGGGTGKIGDFLKERYLECEGYCQILLRGPDELELINVRFFVRSMEKTIDLLVDAAFELDCPNRNVRRQS